MKTLSDSIEQYELIKKGYYLMPKKTKLGEIYKLLLPVTSLLLKKDITDKLIFKVSSKMQYARIYTARNNSGKGSTQYQHNFKIYIKPIGMHIWNPLSVSISELKELFKVPNQKSMKVLYGRSSGTKA